MATLYRKYRPQNFDEVVGQNHIKLTLSQEIKLGKIAHAYLFCGPRAVGKTTLARVFAKAVNCQNKKNDSANPCSECRPCSDITEGRALDIVEIDAASNTGVDNVRENIIANARVAPGLLSYKVFIIDEVHMLSTAAFNALLKIIEEPPKFVIFILCTTEIHKVPATIISRCQRFDFKKISVSDMTKKLSYIANMEKIKIDKKILEAIARQAEGHMRDAESLLGQIVAISNLSSSGELEVTQNEADLVIPRSDLNETISLLEALSKKDSAVGISLINNLADNGVDLRLFVDDILMILRRMMLSKVNPRLINKLGLDLGESMETRLTNLLAKLNIERIIMIIEKFVKVRTQIKESGIIQFPFEIAIIELCQDVSIAQTPGLSPASATARPIFQAKNISSKIAETNEPKVELASNISKETIVKRWNEVLAKVKQYNHSLSFILRVCQPKDLNGSQLFLAFKYKFHKNRVSEPNIKVLIEKVLRQVYGTPLSINALVDESIEVVTEETAPSQQNQNSQSDDKLIEKNTNNDGGELIENIIKNFGGRLIN